MLFTGKTLKDGTYIIKGANYASHVITPAGVYQSYCPNITEARVSDAPVDLDRLKQIKIAQFWKGCGVNIGADPEIFVVDENDIIIPAFNFLPPATKALADKTAPYTDKEKIYNDGFQAEFTVYAQTCVSGIVDSYQRQLQFLLTTALAHNPKSKLSCSSVLEIPEQLRIMAESSNVQLGCMPSLNAYNMGGEIVTNGRELPIRFVGSHIHIGTSREDCNAENAADGVKAMDGLVGVASIALFGNKENLLRRKFYGLAGEYRLPAHGLEYRVVSGQMLHHPVYVHFLLDLSRFASRIGLSKLYEAQTKVQQESVIECINNSDQKTARGIIKENSEIFKAFIDNAYGSNKTDIWNLLIGKSKIRHSIDLAKNWRLGEGKPVMYTGTPSYGGAPGTKQDPNVKQWFMHSEGPNCSVSRLELRKSEE